MALFKEWEKLIKEERDEGQFRVFWKEYSEAETRIYSDILDHPDEPVEGTLGELAEKYDVRPVIFMGFLDGINESIKEKNELDDYDENTPVHPAPPYSHSPAGCPASAGPGGPYPLV